MNRKTFIDAIESRYKCELLEDREGFNLFIDDFFGDFTTIINTDDTFYINIDIYDEHYTMHYGIEKFPAVSTLAYYKSVVSALENEFCTHHDLIESQEFDTSRGLIYTIGYFCEKFDINLINRICEIITNSSYVMDVFHSNAYDQALLETIFNDDDYRDNGSLRLDGNKLVSKSGNDMIFTGDVSAILPHVCLEEFIEADNIYIGLNYAVIKSTTFDKMAVIDSKYIKIFNRISDEYEIAEMKYYSNFSHLVYVKSEKLKFVSTIVRINEVAVINEYELLSKQIYDLKRIAPTIPIKTSYDFSHLSADEFEMLCFDLLNHIGYQDVKLMGKTNAPDGGIDIMANKENNKLFKTERCKWIFQCKHSKKSLDRKEIYEIGDLIEEHNAQGYGLFCSNNLTPLVIARLENKKERLGGNVVYYSKAEMTVLIEKHPNLAVKYRL